MIRHLIALSNRLDYLGLIKEADSVDSIILKSAQDSRGVDLADTSTKKSMLVFFPTGGSLTNETAQSAYDALFTAAQNAGQPMWLSIYNVSDVIQSENSDEDDVINWAKTAGYDMVLSTRVVDIGMSGGVRNIGISARVIDTETRTDVTNVRPHNITVQVSEGEDAKLNIINEFRSLGTRMVRQVVGPGLASISNGEEDTKAEPDYARARFAPETVSLDLGTEPQLEGISLDLETEPQFVRAIPSYGE